MGSHILVAVISVQYSIIIINKKLTKSSSIFLRALDLDFQSSQSINMHAEHHLDLTLGQ